MIKITFMGAGSTVFAKNVLGDCLCTPALQQAEICLYDIDKGRLEDSAAVISAMNDTLNAGRATVKTFLGKEERKNALRDATFVVNAIQVGGYDPSTIIDFEIPKKFGLRQTIADTLGVGGIMRALRTIPVLKEFADDMEEVCPNAWFLNYTNPMAMLTGFMLRYTKVKTVGLCHSVQSCASGLLEWLDLQDKVDGHKSLIAGINHMGWLLEIEDKDGVDLYPEIRSRAAAKNAAGPHHDMVRYDYIAKFGHYCTESSEHNAEYNPFYIKAKAPELIERFNIPLDEYPRRCISQIEEWKARREAIVTESLTHTRTEEYASYIMEAMVTNNPYKIGGNVLNTGLIENLVSDACVEVPCLVDGRGVHPCYVGRMPVALAGMNMTNINAQLMTIEAAVSKKRSDIYNAVMLDPHAAAELTIDEIIAMCDEMIDAHGDFMKEYR